MDAQADGLGESLLGRETGRQVAQAAALDPHAPGAPDVELTRPEHFLGKAITAALQRRGDAAYIAQVGADAVDHAGAEAW